MEQNPGKANSRFADQETPRILRNPKVHYHIHMKAPLDPMVHELYESSPHPHTLFL
jgi:hypothetical protein